MLTYYVTSRKRQFEEQSRISNKLKFDVINYSKIQLQKIIKTFLLSFVSDTNVYKQYTRKYLPINIKFLHFCYPSRHPSIHNRALSLIAQDSVSLTATILWTLWCFSTGKIFPRTASIELSTSFKQDSEALKKVIEQRIIVR